MYADSVPAGIDFERAATRSELDQDQYDAGYFTDDGEFKSLSQGNSNSGWLLDEGGFTRLAENKSSEPVLIYDKENAEAFDARSVVTDGEYRQARYEQQHQDSTRTIKETRA
jgi:hypothetical protein